MKIIFVRHGESQANIFHTISNRKLPHGLTLNGQNQAAALADHLMGFRISKIYSSPIPRAVETGNIIAHRLGIEITQVDALREFDCGIIEGLSDKAAWQIYEELFDAWKIYLRYEQRIDGGESFNDVKRRFVPFIEGLNRENRDTSNEILCISHGGTYFFMLPLVLQNVDQAKISKYGFAYASCIIAEQVNDGLVCTRWNDHSFVDE